MRGVLLAVAILATMIFCSTSSAQYGGYGYNTHSTCGSSYCPPTTYVSYSGWKWECWPRDHRYYYKTRYAYDAYGQSTYQHDGWLYTRSYHNGAYCYYQHCKIPSPSVDSYVEKVVVREIPVLVAPPQVGTTAYGTPIRPFGRLDQVPVTDLMQLANQKIPDDGQAVANNLALTAKYMAEASGKVAADAQQTIREKNAALAENQRILIQGAVAENVAVKALQGVSALGTQNFVGQDGSLNQGGADALSLVISNNCLQCHGGEKVEAGLDFKNFGDFDQKTKLRCLTKVATGQMPPRDSGKKELSDQQVKLFEAWVLNGK
jgi:mono/diheme cytochrome c family protein